MLGLVLIFFCLLLRRRRRRFGSGCFEWRQQFKRLIKIADRSRAASRSCFRLAVALTGSLTYSASPAAVPPPSPLVR